MPNMPKPEPFASPNIKKAGPAQPEMMAALKKLSPEKLKQVLALLMKMGGTPKSESPMPYTRLGSGMEMD
jgi:hypothetical protein